MGCIITGRTSRPRAAALTLKLWPLGPGAALNPAGDAFTETAAEGVSPGYREAVISEDVSDGVWCQAILYDEDGNPAGQGLVKVFNDGRRCFVNKYRTGESLAYELAQELASTKHVHTAIPALEGNALNAPIVRGASYLEEHSRQIPFSRNDWEDIPDGSSVILTASGQKNGEVIEFECEGTITSPTGDTKAIQFTPDSAETGDWEPGCYTFQVDIIYPDGNTAPFVGPGCFLEVIDRVELED